MTYEAQTVCEGCGARHLNVVDESRQAGHADTSATACPDCEGKTTVRVTVVYDPDEYDLADPYGPGVDLRARCVDCGAGLYGPVETCTECDSPRLHRWLGEADP